MDCAKRRGGDDFQNCHRPHCVAVMAGGGRQAGSSVKAAEGPEGRAIQEGTAALQSAQSREGMDQRNQRQQRTKQKPDSKDAPAG